MNSFNFMMYFYFCDIGIFIYGSFFVMVELAFAANSSSECFFFESVFTFHLVLIVFNILPTLFLTLTRQVCK
jgi:hypothetical protein